MRGRRASHQALLAQAQNQGWHRLSGFGEPRSHGAVAPGPRHSSGEDKAGPGPATFVWASPPARTQKASTETARGPPGISRFPRARRIPALLHRGPRSRGRGGHRARQAASTVRAAAPSGPGGKVLPPRMSTASPGPVSPA